MDDRAVDALFLLTITISILAPVNMIARFFLSGIVCIIASLLITATIVTALYVLFRRWPSNGK